MSEAFADPPGPMTVEAFLRWAVDQGGGRYDLMDGYVVAMSPETGAHLRTKAAAHRALEAAIAAAGLDCQALPDGATVRVDATTAFEPDATVNRGEPMGDRATDAPNPVVVVEVVSRTSRRADSGTKLEGYFRVPSIHHYLLLAPETRTVVHHRRGEAGRIETAILREGTLVLDPPGLRVEVAALFPPAR